MVKKDLNTLLATKMLKKLSVYLYFYQKWPHIEKTKYVSFLIKDDKLLEKYTEIWDKVSYTIRK